MGRYILPLRSGTWKHAAPLTAITME